VIICIYVKLQVDINNPSKYTCHVSKQETIFKTSMGLSYLNGCNSLLKKTFFDTNTSVEQKQNYNLFISFNELEISASIKSMYSLQTINIHIFFIKWIKQYTLFIDKECTVLRVFRIDNRFFAFKNNNIAPVRTLCRN